MGRVGGGWQAGSDDPGATMCLVVPLVSWDLWGTRLNLFVLILLPGDVGSRAVHPSLRWPCHMEHVCVWWAVLVGKSLSSQLWQGSPPYLGANEVMPPLAVSGLRHGVCCHQLLSSLAPLYRWGNRGSEGSRPTPC